MRDQGRGPRQPFLIGRGLVKRRGGHRVLAGVDIAIRSGDVLAPVGPSGAGKTTLLHVLAAMSPPDAGEVVLGGHRIERLGDHDRIRLLRSVFGFVLPRKALCADLTVEENVALPLLLAGMTRETALREARRWLLRLTSPRVGSRSLSELPDDEALLVAIAQALSQRPKVVIIDDPPEPLRGSTCEALINVLCDIAAETASCVLLATRDRSLAYRAPRIVELCEGRVTGGLLVG